MTDQNRCVAADAIKEIEVLIRARYPVIYVLTWEETRVEEAIAEIAARRGKKVFTWSICRGIAPYGTPLQSRRSADEKTCDPATALGEVMDFIDPAVFIFKDFHPYLTDPAVVRKVRDAAFALENTYKTLILVSPAMKLPTEIEKEVSVVDFALPGREEIGELLERTVAEVNKTAGLGIKLTGDGKEAIVGAALGLLRCRHHIESLCHLHHLAAGEDRARIRDGDSQRHLAAPARADAQRALRRDILRRPAQPGGADGDIQNPHRQARQET